MDRVFSHLYAAMSVHPAIHSIPTFHAAFLSLLFNFLLFFFVQRHLSLHCLSATALSALFFASVFSQAYHAALYAAWSHHALISHLSFLRRIVPSLVSLYLPAPIGSFSMLLSLAFFFPLGLSPFLHGLLAKP